MYEGSRSRAGGSRLPERQRELRDCLETRRIERIVRPASFLSITHQAGVTQNLEMKRQAGLGGIEHIL
jgi:hypothetical protein